MDNVILGKHIKDARLKVNMTAETLAEKVDITPKSLWQIESGRRSPSMALFVRLCKVLEVSSDYLLAKELDKNMNELKSEYMEVFNTMLTLTPNEFTFVGEMIKSLIKYRD